MYCKLGLNCGCSKEYEGKCISSLKCENQTLSQKEIEDFIDYIFIEMKKQK